MDDHILAKDQFSYLDLESYVKMLKPKDMFTQDMFTPMFGC